ncbi:hypothetical protein MTR67_034427 [Solanum verrucosum]|uniref:Tf2-1-like SH3-like domain-containing protein n=1 Tax=Solanum verrucosum TaxID=315347 RepID=A0AAF0ZJ86_SOLVR|nr:hypothetical protein MTR67_034427 [Solanum verrucosum]
MKGVMRFGEKGKLSPRYIDPYRISKRIGNIAYQLEQPQELDVVYPILDYQFHKLRTKEVASIKGLREENGEEKRRKAKVHRILEIFLVDFAKGVWCTATLSAPEEVFYSLPPGAPALLCTPGLPGNPMLAKQKMEKRAYNARNKAQEGESSVRRSARVRNKLACEFKNDLDYDYKGKQRRMTKKK